MVNDAMNMKTLVRHSYIRPCIIARCELQLEDSFLASVVDYMHAVETAGQEKSGFYDVSSLVGENTFSHDWK